ncbi:lysophospholipid acyltransferase family protein [Sphingomonas solaris]|uniref:1-acyl-sn-glycerol-3-phosphate acyltransferase n=1 Tax=Alterirhizorhabdus solaris TaxID=2529389 RepID=A0A558R4F3_9SPHN|nr:lysophospholipid acyltransferase family protein [Sphingomonas solaris]TVV74265.1 1-acyl-sn-glycerol-3-phosphate acyltransferase [Sphingomonas solaris]
MRLWLRLARTAGVLAAALPGHALDRARGRPSRQVRRFLGRAGHAFGLRVTVAGEPLDRDVLYLANHVSWLDILALGGATGAAFVSKDDVEGWPVVGWLARQGGTIFIHRQSRAAVRGQADALATALAGGRPVALFPEGTTGNGTALLPFRASLLAAVEAAPPGLRVQPVAIDYGPAARKIAWTGNEGTGGNAKRVGGRPGPLPVTLRFLSPIDPVRAGGRKAIAAAARDAIGAALSASGTIDYRPAP